MNEPDLVLFVGEALVGNEAVDQLVKFNQAMADYSSSTNPHLIDGIVLTKFDTIDDKVCILFEFLELLIIVIIILYAYNVLSFIQPLICPFYMFCDIFYC